MSTLRVQFDWLAGTTEFPRAMAYQLPPMWMIDGNLAAGRARWEMNDDRERLLVRRSELAVVRGLAFCSSAYGNRFFGHHLTDDLPLALAAEAFGPPHYANPPDRLPVNIGAYRDVCGIDHPSVWNARVEDCWVFCDAHLTDSKVERLQRMRAAIRSAWGPGYGHERVFVRRGPSGVQRGPGNGEAVIDHLRDDGWVIIDPERMTTAEVARSLFDAELVAGVEGSQLAHAIVAAPTGAGLVPFIPPDRFNLLIKDFADRLGIAYGFHVGVPSETGWDVDLPGALRILDRMSSRVG